MHVSRLLHGFFKNSLFFIHSKRRQAVMNAVSSLLSGKRLSLTQLGRSMQGKSKERHCIRKMDRLLGNEKLHMECKYYYEEMSKMTIGHIQRPIINIDWTIISRKHKLSTLRASVAVKGRGVVIYQKTYSSQENSPRAEKAFMQELKEILPRGCKPIIVTDAGFKCPWFKMIRKIGFDFVGRVRMVAGYQPQDEDKWYKCLELYKTATRKARLIGQVLLTKGHKLDVSLVLFKGPKQNRKHINQSGKPYSSTEEKRDAQRNREPLLLATSLDTKEYSAKSIVNIYKKRMQIEEEFRDLKSHRYGFSMEDCNSRTDNRINVLLLIAAIATFGCWLVALAAHRDKVHYDYHANSIKNTNVLAICYLACQMIRRNHFFKKAKLLEALDDLRTMVLEACHV